jgi:hypothetical protein
LDFFLTINQGVALGCHLSGLQPFIGLRRVSPWRDFVSASFLRLPRVQRLAQATFFLQLISSKRSEARRSRHAFPAFIQTSLFNQKVAKKGE